MMSLAQLFVPIKMIFDNEDVLSNGVRYQLKIAKLNPDKAIYGDFIRLKFEYNSILTDKDDWQQSEAAYVQLVVREDAFAEISSIHRQIPDQTQDYVYVKIYDIEKLDAADKLIIEYPSINYYIEEIGSKERKKNIIIQFFNDTSDAKAIVFVKEGKLILKEILIDDIPLKEKILNLDE